ncbi:unnamed protein product, partial [Ixodes persulcatus]
MLWEKQFRLGQRLGVCGGRASLEVEGAAGVASRTGSEPGRSRARAGPPRIVVGSAEFRSVDKEHVPHVRAQLPSKRVDRRPRAASRPDRTRAADDSDPPREPRRGRPGVGTRSGLARADGADKRDGTMGRQKRGPSGNPGGNTVKHDNHPANNKDKNDDDDVNRSGIQRSSEAEERELARLGTAYTARASATPPQSSAVRFRPCAQEQLVPRHGCRERLGSCRARVPSALGRGLLEADGAVG